MCLLSRSGFKKTAGGQAMTASLLAKAQTSRSFIADNFLIVLRCKQTHSMLMGCCIEGMTEAFHCSARNVSTDSQTFQYEDLLQLQENQQKVCNQRNADTQSVRSAQKLF